MTYIDSPELLNTVEADDFLQQLVPVLLSRWGLGEPEGPSMGKWVLDIEVVGVVEDGDSVTILSAAACAVCTTFRRDGDRVERDRRGWVLCDGGHGEIWVVGSFGLGVAIGLMDAVLSFTQGEKKSEGNKSGGGGEMCCVCRVRPSKMLVQF